VPVQSGQKEKGMKVALVRYVESTVILLGVNEIRVPAFTHECAENGR
jgi:hypothetical protein